MGIFTDVYRKSFVQHIHAFVDIQLSRNTAVCRLEMSITTILVYNFAQIWASTQWLPSYAKDHITQPHRPCCDLFGIRFLIEFPWHPMNRINLV